MSGAPILIMAGGTGGHVFPALALARLSRYPRTDASGALVVGLVLSLTSGAILLTRLLAVARDG
jgi:hypothetical protein